MFSQEEIKQFYELNKESIDFMMMSLPKEERTEENTLICAHQMMVLLSKEE